MNEKNDNETNNINGTLLKIVESNGKLTEGFKNLKDDFKELKEVFKSYANSIDLKYSNLAETIKMNDNEYNKTFLKKTDSTNTLTTKIVFNTVKLILVGFIGALIYNFKELVVKIFK